MGVSLDKGANVSLDKLAEDAGETLTSITLGLGWDARTTAGKAFDLDASAFGLTVDGKVPTDEWFVFYGHDEAPSGVIKHHGDNVTGDGAGDDERITLQLDKLPENIQRVILAVTIYQAEERGQKFGDVRNAFVRAYTQEGTELVRYDLGEDYSTETAVVFAEVYRHNGVWKFRAVGQGYTNGLKGLSTDYGVNVS